MRERIWLVVEEIGEHVAAVELDMMSDVKSSSSIHTEALDDSLCKFTLSQRIAPPPPVTNRKSAHFTFFVRHYFFHCLLQQNLTRWPCVWPLSHWKKQIKLFNAERSFKAFNKINLRWNLVGLPLVTTNRMVCRIKAPWILMKQISDANRYTDTRLLFAKQILQNWRVFVANTLALKCCQHILPSTGTLGCSKLTNSRHRFIHGGITG